jgi:hypothetical protein
MGNGSDSSGLIGFFAIVIFIAIIVGLIYALNDSSKKAKQSELAISQIASRLPSDKQGI